METNQKIETLFRAALDATPAEREKSSDLSGRGNTHGLERSAVKEGAEIDQQKDIQQVEKSGCSTDRSHQKRCRPAGKAECGKEQKGSGDPPEKQTAEPVAPLFRGKGECSENQLQQGGEEKQIYEKKTPAPQECILRHRSFAVCCLALCHAFSFGVRHLIRSKSSIATYRSRHRGTRSMLHFKETLSPIFPSSHVMIPHPGVPAQERMM